MNRDEQIFQFDTNNIKITVEIPGYTQFVGFYPMRLEEADGIVNDKVRMHWIWSWLENQFDRITEMSKPQYNKQDYLANKKGKMK
jgi:hypothetical protein